MGNNYYLIFVVAIVGFLAICFWMFERRSPQARELVLLSVICAVAVVGRMVFFMLPNFKPVIAITIIAGVGLGSQAGFLVGAISMLVSNFSFGMGPLTPFQMFATGIIGFLAGIIFYRRNIKKIYIPLCIYGGVATFVIYGGIMNPAGLMLLSSGQEFTWPLLIASYVQGLRFDTVHAASSIVFLAVLSPLILYILNRMRVKYGLGEAPRNNKL